MGGGNRNAFGLAFDANGKVWNSRLCNADSDNDGKTNGVELGDPNCVWTEGAVPEITSGLSHPGVCEPWDSERCLAHNQWEFCDREVFSCPAMDATEDLKGGESDVRTKFATPTLCGMDTGCTNLITGWGPGLPGQCFSERAAFRIGKHGYKYAVMQMHWNNPELRSHYTDSSGLTLFYTPNLRPNDAGSFVVGQRYLDIKPGLESHTETAMASSSCTRKMLPYPIHILNNVLHMHYLGKSGYIDLRRNGNKLKTLGRDDVFSYDSPVQHVHDPPIEFLPGDEVFVSCTFDSRSKSETTYYGYDTSAEMCYGFFQYYPVIGNLTSMLNYKDVELCFNWGPRGGGEGLIVGGCSLTNAVIQSFSMKVMAKCSMTGDVCQPECKEMVKETRLNDECMGNEDVFGLVKVLSEGEPRLENIWRAFESCDDEIKMDDVLTRLILSLV
ncbi:unnamed protein product [Owenia fusiformis]|uniref:Uncharacterized protein n=1 Tax=Owenia fusiformis TaxID=6347 RepID=A0A8J1TBB4_OWEFU|nr:unnamed protein product [Owenia fusiformis]